MLKIGSMYYFSSLREAVMCSYNTEKGIRKSNLPAFINVIELMFVILIHYLLNSTNLLYLRLHFFNSLAIILIVREILYLFIYPEGQQVIFVTER